MARTRIVPRRPNLSARQISQAVTSTVNQMIAQQGVKWSSQRQTAITALLVVNRAIAQRSTETLAGLDAELHASIAELF